MKHSAWTTFRQTDPKRKPKTQRELSLPSFKATWKNLERWMDQLCVACEGQFEEGQIVCEFGTGLLHGRCA